MSQNAELLSYLRANKVITDLEALTELGIRRLAARVHDLRGQGHSIDTDMVEVRTRNGTARVARYYLRRAKE